MLLSYFKYQPTCARSPCFRQTAGTVTECRYSVFGDVHSCTITLISCVTQWVECFALKVRVLRRWAPPGKPLILIAVVKWVFVCFLCVKPNKLQFMTEMKCGTSVVTLGTRSMPGKPTPQSVSGRINQMSRGTLDMFHRNSSNHFKALHMSSC